MSVLLVRNNFEKYNVSIFRCLGFIMAKMVLPELMDPLIFTRFKSFLMKVKQFMLSSWLCDLPRNFIGGIPA